MHIELVRTTTAPTSFTFKQLRAITENFSDEQKYGHGAYGEVFEGKRGDGEVIAVKMFSCTDTDGLDGVQFKNVFKNLSRLKHQNILNLVGYCYDSMTSPRKIERALCFGYWHNGNLQKHLSDEYSELDWHTSYKIIKGTCEGLKYLHEMQKENIYQLDIKADNILLDMDMEPKLAYFGLSKIFGEKETKRKQSSIETTADDKDTAGQFIFSIGVLMINIVSGRQEQYRNHEKPDVDLLDMVHANWRKKLQSVMAGSVQEAYYQQVKRCTNIAMNCMHRDTKKRPSIDDIVLQLNESETQINNLRNITKHAKEKLSFPSGPMKASCSYKLANTTRHCLAITWSEVRAVRSTALRYEGDWIRGILPPGSTSELTITRIAQEGGARGDDMECQDKIILSSTVVSSSSYDQGFRRMRDTSYDMFTTQNLHVVELDISLITPFRPYYGMGLQDFLITESMSSTQFSSSTSKELLQLDSTEIPLPFEPNKEVSCSVQLLNNTDDYVAFHTEVFWVYFGCRLKPRSGILAPRSVCDVVITNQAYNNGNWEAAGLLFPIMEINATVRVLSTVVNKEFRCRYICEDMFRTESGRIVDIAYVDVFLAEPNYYSSSSSHMSMQALKCTQQCRPPTDDYIDERLKGSQQHISIISCPREELVKFIPPVIHVEPFSERLLVARYPALVNNTDEYVAFLWTVSERMGMEYTVDVTENCLEAPDRGILAPRATVEFCVIRLYEKEMSSMKKNMMDVKIHAWTAVVNQDFDAKNITDDMFEPSTAGRVVYHTFLTVVDAQSSHVQGTSSGNLSWVSLMDNSSPHDDEKTPPKNEQTSQLDHVSTSITGTNHLDIHPTEPLILATQDGGGVLILWNYETQEEKVVEIVEKGGGMHAGVCSALFITRRQWIVAATRSCLYLHTDDLEKKIDQVDGESQMSCLAVHPCEPYVLVGGRFIFVRDYENGFVKIHSIDLERPVRQVAFYNSMSTQCLARSTTEIKIWNLISNEYQGTFATPRPKIKFLLADYFTRHADLHLIVAFGNTAEIWRCLTNRRVHILEGHTAQVTQLCSHPGLGLLITGSNDGSVRLWNSDTFRHEGTLNIGLGKVCALACLKGSTSIVIGCDNGIAMTDIGSQVHGSSMGERQ